jgi:hypothetical protein
MATAEAIAYLGDSLKAILAQGLGGAVANNVKLSTPDEFKSSPPNAPAVTIFLYHVAICGDMRNARPATSLKGLLGKPPLPLQMRFLITPWTNSAREAYDLVGQIALIMNDNAQLGAADLLGAGVWAADDTVEFMLEPIPVAELYDIWEPTQIPYKLSLSYLARVVGLDSPQMTAAAPVASETLARPPQ